MAVSIVIPVYNEDESLPELYTWIDKVLKEWGKSGEIIFIDDGCTDDSWSIIADLSARDSRVIGIRFNRNYGKSAALQVGFQQAKGDIVITMDADLQDSPEEIPALYNLIKEEGFHLVSGWKKKRHDPLEKRLPSKFFNYVTSVVSGIKLHDFNCGLKAYQNRVVKSVEVYGERHRYIPLLAKWSGFKNIGEKEVEHHARKYGRTKFGFERYVTGFLDLLSVTFVTRFRKRPMHLFGTLGILSFLTGFMITLYLISEKLYNLYNLLPVRDVVDQPLFFLALVALVIGVQLFLAGFIGEMLVQSSPKTHEYLIAENTQEDA
ncbi:MAG: glycosyltransferase family 2 protein [Cyclobacteriaceae bacterium]|nr:glycosyltransferase family 2 protein [Cyclobacteriaceae bacterium HetDA_MAG_MS6]